MAPQHVRMPRVYNLFLSDKLLLFPKVILLIIIVWEAALIVDASQCKDCSADLDGDVCVIKCFGNFSADGLPALRMNHTYLRNDYNCMENSSDVDVSRAYCKFPTNIGVKIMKHGTYVFECNPNHDSGGAICKFATTFDESTCLIRNDPPPENPQCIKGFITSPVPSPSETSHVTSPSETPTDSLDWIAAPAIIVSVVLLIAAIIFGLCIYYHKCRRKCGNDGCQGDDVPDGRSQPRTKSLKRD